MPEQNEMERAATESVVERAEVAIGKLKNGAGTVTTCPAHGAMASALVCISEMMIPVYKETAKRRDTDMPEIKSKYFTARGVSAMLPMAIIVSIACICYTFIRILEPK
jgi:hypothetical protein